MVGFGLLMRHQMRPNVTAAAAPPKWPLTNPQLAGRFSLLMTIHPQCPCSRASLDELEQILPHTTKPVDVQFLFVVPSSAPANWLEGSTWDKARSIPMNHVVIDNGGQRAALLGATTSGEVFLYSPDGKLCFHGGITDGRGHEGENPGTICVREILNGRIPATQSTPVYGCKLGPTETAAQPGSNQ